LDLGMKYYIESDHHDRAAAAHLGATYTLLGESTPADGTNPKIGADQIATYVLDHQTITFTGQPQSVTNGTGTKATFTVAVQESGVSFHWQKNGTNITGAPGATYTTDFLALSDNGAKYHAVATLLGTTATSAD